MGNDQAKTQPFPAEVLDCIRRALEEDIGTGDVTTNSIVPSQASMSGQIFAKQAGIVAGLDVAQAVFHLLDEGVHFAVQVEEGDRKSVV